jgi:hypothetical protein
MFRIASERYHLTVITLKTLEGPQQLFAQLLMGLWVTIAESFKESEVAAFWL